MLFLPTPLFGASGAAPFTNYDSVAFNGTNTVGARGANLTGISDSATGILSAWWNATTDGGVDVGLISSADTSLTLFWRTSPNFLDINFRTAGKLFQWQSTAQYAPGGGWHQIVASWNTNLGAGSKICTVMIDGAFDAGSVTDAASAFSVQYSASTNWYTFDNRSGSATSSVGMGSEIYFNPAASYLDVSQAGNLAKFRTAGGKPANLGLDGSTPTGSQPILYQHVDSGGTASTFATSNKGSGGNYTASGTWNLGASKP